jgi:hypothetical protein
LPRIIDERARLLALLDWISRLHGAACSTTFATGHIGTEQAARRLVAWRTQWCDRHAMEVRNVETGAEQLASERTNLRAAAVELLQP